MVEIILFLFYLSGRSITEDILFDVMQTGAVLCELAHIICNHVEKNLKHRNRPKSAYVTSANHPSTGGRPVSVQSAFKMGIDFIVLHLTHLS